MSSFASTRTDAVNTILRAVGETPVSNLETENGPDVEMAEATLDQVNREVQNLGWEWNSGISCYTPDVDGHIELPGTVLRFSLPSNSVSVRNAATRYTSVRYVRLFKRNGLLYNRNTESDVFDADVFLDIVEYLDWEDMPEAARAYITLRAARRFADHTLGDAELSRYTRQDEQEAAFALRKEELSTGNRRIFDTNTEIGIDYGSPIDYYPG